MAPSAKTIVRLLGTETEVELLESRTYTFGRSRDASLPLRDPSCSRRQFEIHRAADGWQLVPVSQDTPTLLNGEIVSGATSLNGGDRIVAGDSAFDFLTASTQGQDQKTLRGSLDHSFDIKQWFMREIVVGNGLLIGRDPSCDLVLNHPMVSRRHAHVVARDGDFFVLDLISTNGTFLNGRSLRSARHSSGEKLSPGDRIDIGPYSLAFTGTHLAPTSRVGNIDLQGRGLTRVVTDRSTGLPLKLLDDVTVRIRPGQFVWPQWFREIDPPGGAERAGEAGPRSSDHQFDRPV
jgi:pSer/pThr/pTyr-binding forkhead associated (FHA) protein